ncbi:Radial spoke head protein 6 like [Schistosoma japonicum]|nr:Radial spoke head protein 6 like [Schistosoma japonicum]
MSEVTRNDGNFLKHKMKLLELTDNYGLNLYQHLKNCIKHMLYQQRSDDFNEFEILSNRLKLESRRHGPGDHLVSNPAAFSTAKIQQKLFMKSPEEDEEPVADEGEEHPLPNVVENAYYFENAGIGIRKSETVLLSMAIKSLVNTQAVQTARFWGKIYGLIQNYYVVEVEFPEGEDMDEEESGDTVNRDATEADDEEGNEEGKDVLPKSRWKPPVKVPKEENHTGTNKKVYFVCHEPGLRWIKLPPVTPEQIVAARAIHRLFTGILDSPVPCYPPFPGTEANYLRAQIARISASTQISPQGYYSFGSKDEEEEELENEEEGERQNCVKNEEYEPLSIDELADPSLQHWVHHTSYILPQGRVYWWNPKKGLGDNFDEFNDEEEEENEDGINVKNTIQPEHGPPILTPISSDLPIFGQKPWSVRISSKLIPEYASVIVSSNIWTGAHAVSWGKRFENIYIGWGIKSVTSGFQPQLQPVEMEEYQENSDLNETMDPTPQEEAALRALLNPPEAEDEANEEQEEEEGDDD